MAAAPEDVALVVEKVQKAYETGEQNNAMAWGKSVPEWKATFNEAASKLKLPVFEVGPLLGPKRNDIIHHVNNIADAFEQTAGQPAIVLADSTGNNFVKDPDMNWRIANFVEQLSVKFPQAIYVQVVPEMNTGHSLWMYCNKPKTPRDPGKPMYPL